MKPIALLAVAALALAGCEKSDPNVWQGYVEGEYAMLASPYAGQLQKLYPMLYRLEPIPEKWS
jgi:hypothetical protein